MRTVLVIAVFLQSTLAVLLSPDQIPFQFGPSTSTTLTSSGLHSNDTRLIRFTYLESNGAKDSITEARSYLESFDLDVWSVSRRHIDVRVTLDQDDIISSILLNSAGKRKSSQPPTKSILIESFNTLLTSSPSSFAPHNTVSSLAALSGDRVTTLADPIHDSYHSYSSIVAILQLFASDYPSLATLFVLGESSQGRPIYGIKITKKDHVLKSDASLKEKMGFVLIGASHGREWIAPSTLLYIIHNLLLSASVASENPLLEVFEFTFIPVLNVDGYEYSWESDRFWKKNRQAVGDECFGIDLNRNWGYKFSPGNRPNRCSDFFPGSAPFEAPELQALSTYLQDPANNVKSFVDMHSYGQLIMFPFSYSCTVIAPHEENLFEASIGAARSLYLIHAKLFESGSVCDVGLASPGSSIDWSYSKGIIWSWSIELRDLGVFGFLLPSSQIRASGEEMTEALRSLAEFVFKKETASR